LPFSPQTATRHEAKLLPDKCVPNHFGNESS
jgi:hypothetical protein